MSETAAPEDQFGLVGTTVADRFRIDVQIAEGGFGIVYRASQLALDRPVAIKVLKTPPGFDHAAREAFRDKFAGEAKTIAKLKDPHIVDVYDFGILRTPAGELAPWMALEWLDGETLETDLARRRGRGGRAPEDAVALLRPVVAAVAHAHKLGIAHRDIKPANIMVSHGDRGPVLRILDFGIAKIMRTDEATGTGRTRTNGLPAFSPAYASPEQVSFSRTGPWTDVHALGLVLTEVLTDEPPFDATDMHVFEQVMAPARPTPAARGKNVGALEAVVARAVALSPGERWKDAGELLRGLELALDGDGGVGAPPPRPEIDVSGDTQPLSPVATAARGGGQTTRPQPTSNAGDHSRRGATWRTGAVVGAVLIVGLLAAAALVRQVAGGRSPPSQAGVAAVAAPAPPAAPALAPTPPPPVPVAARAPARASDEPGAKTKPTASATARARAPREPHHASHVARGEAAEVAAAPPAPSAPPEKKKTSVLDRFEKLVDRPTVEAPAK